MSIHDWNCICYSFIDESLCLRWRNFTDWWLCSQARWSNSRRWSQWLLSSVFLFKTFSMIFEKPLKFWNGNLDFFKDFENCFKILRIFEEKKTIFWRENIKILNTLKTKKTLLLSELWSLTKTGKCAEYDRIWCPNLSCYVWNWRNSDLLTSLAWIIGSIACKNAHRYLSSLLWALLQDKLTLSTTSADGSNGCAEICTDQLRSLSTSHHVSDRNKTSMNFWNYE